MAQAAKFLFDRNFETPANDAEPPEVLRERELRKQFEAELQAARQAEYRRGLDEGRAEAARAAEAATERVVAELADCAENILRKLDGECAAIRAEAVKIAVAAADCVASELIRRHPTTMLEALFAECLEHLADAPHVAVRVHDSVAEALQEKLAAAAEAKGFPGRIMVLGDPETAKGDCRIEWADGGISRDLESLRLSISEIVARHLPERRADDEAPAPAQQPATEAQAEASAAHEPAGHEPIPTMDRENINE